MPVYYNSTNKNIIGIKYILWQQRVIIYTLKLLYNSFSHIVYTECQGMVLADKLTKIRREGGGREEREKEGEGERECVGEGGRGEGRNRIKEREI